MSGEPLPKRSRPAHEKCPQLISNTDQENSLHMITPSRPIKQLNLNPPSKQMTRTPPLGKDEGLILLTREQFLESCSRGKKCVEKITNASNAKARTLTSRPSLQEHTIKLFGKIIKTTITIAEEEEEEGEDLMKHFKGKEAVSSDRIRTDEIAEMKDDVVEGHGRKAWVSRWVSNHSKITIMMSGSGEEADEVKKVPSAAAMAMVGRALKGAPPCRIKKMNGYSVWD